jgi:Ca-activated chloride channel homolog
VNVRRISTGFAIALSAAFISQPGVPTGTFEAAGAAVRPTTYVAAVRDSRLLTMCAAVTEVPFANGRVWKADGRAVASPSSDDTQTVTLAGRAAASEHEAQAYDGNREARGAEFIASHVRLPLPLGAPGRQAPGDAPNPGRVELGRGRIVIDTAIGARIEREFQRLGKYLPVDGPEQADFVFLTEVTYTWIGSSTTDLTSYTGGTGRASVTVSGTGDWEPNLIQSALAIVVPAAAYQSGPASVQGLVAARIWEGSALLVPPFTYRRTVPRDEADGSRSTAIVDQSKKTWTSASPEALVRQFHDKERRPSSHPALCQASNGPAAVQVTWATSDRRTKPTRATLAGVSTVPGVEQQASPALAGTPAASTFRSAVTYVSLPLVATDAAGKPVFDLSPPEIRLFEDDAPQTLDRLMTAQEPFSIGLLIDTSESMRAKREDVQSAALTLIDALRAGDRMLLACFNGRVFVESELTADRGQLQSAIRRLSSGVPTRLYDAIDLVYAERLSALPGRKALVALTDGADTFSRMADVERTLATIGESHIPVYVVQYDTSQDNTSGVNAAVWVQEPPKGYRPGRPDPRPPAQQVELNPIPAPRGARERQLAAQGAAGYLWSITAASGGRLYRAWTLPSLADAFTQVASDLGTQYAVCYYPSNQAHDGTTRRIRIEVGRPGTTVRTRASYLAPSR